MSDQKRRMSALRCGRRDWTIPTTAHSRNKPIGSGNTARNCATFTNAARRSKAMSSSFPPKSTNCPKTVTSHSSPACPMLISRFKTRIRRDEAGRDLSGNSANRAEALNRTLDEMRLLAREMARLETRASIEMARPVISFEETREAEREGGIEAGGRGIFHDEGYESAADFQHPEIARLDEEAV